MRNVGNAASLGHGTMHAGKQLPTKPYGDGGHADGRQMFDPELILPVQYARPRAAAGRCEGERRLMLAVLEDAVVTLKLHMRGPSGHSRRIVAETENWLASGSRAHIFAFGTICDVLGFDTTAVRQAVKGWTRVERRDPRYRRMHSGRGRHQIGLVKRRRR
jgi:hypothetical protein